MSSARQRKGKGAAGTTTGSTVGTSGTSAAAAAPKTPIPRALKAAAICCGVLVASAIAVGRHVHFGHSVAELEPIYARPEDGSRFLEVAGHARVHYRNEIPGDSGDAVDTSLPPVLLIHGTSSSLHTWDAWAAELVRSGRRVIRCDLPGFGLTGPHSSPDFGYSAEEWADFLAAFLDALSADAAAAGHPTLTLGPKVDVAGNSLGGHVAWMFAARHPRRVRRLILIDAAGPYERDYLPMSLKIAKTPYVRHLVKYVTPRFAFERSLKEVYPDPTVFDGRVITPALVGSDADGGAAGGGSAGIGWEALVNRHYKLQLVKGNRHALVQRVANFDLEVSRRAQYRALLHSITAPTLIQWGTLDTWLPPRWASSFAEDIPAAKIKLYDGIGHCPMEEDPATTVADAIAFLS